MTIDRGPGAGIAGEAAEPTDAEYVTMWRNGNPAGWAGLFVTALNLLPIGQLDGGHVVYALLGRRSRWLSLAVVVGFVLMAILVSTQWLLLALLLLVFGIRHPPTRDDTVPIDPRRRLIGVVLMIVLVLSFTPRPFAP